MFWRMLRAAMAVLIGAAILLPTSLSAAPSSFAGIVVDAKSGKVLYQKGADAPRFPASVTKVMTLYILFQELSAGNIRLSDKMKVSSYAAKAVPTKLGLKAGSTISVENAIKAIVTLSANDMARVIAEHISGSEGAFARRMTATAKALGMSRTAYFNASGLPDRRQITTVRDQSILGIAVFEHFPKYYAYFQTRSFTYGRRTYGNHNRLLGSNGVDGIKTGYTGAAGFNLLTAARKDNKHIVVAAFGFPTSGSRDAKVRDLVKTYLPKARQGDYLQTAMIAVPGRKGKVASPQLAATDPVEVAAVDDNAVVPLPPPSFRASVPVVELVAEGDTDEGFVIASLPPTPTSRPAAIDIGIPSAAQAVNQLGEQSAVPQRPRPLDIIGAWLSDTLSLGAQPAPLGQTRPSAPLLPPVGIGENGQPIDLMTSGSIGEVDSQTATGANAPQKVAVAEVQVMPQALTGGWVVQIGAAPTETGASALLGDAAAQVSPLGGFRPFVERFEKNGQIYFRARFAGFTGREDAIGMCTELKKVKMSCLAMQS